VSGDSWFKDTTIRGAGWVGLRRCSCSRRLVVGGALSLCLGSRFKAIDSGKEARRDLKPRGGCAGIETARGTRGRGDAGGGRSLYFVKWRGSDEIGVCCL
jgi:hypothetical protein